MATLTTSYQMIANKYIGTISGSGVSAKDLYLRIYAKYNSQNISNNQTSVTYRSVLYVSGSGTYFYTGSTTTKSLSGTGISSISGNAAGDYYVGETTLNESSATITHNAAGEASISATAGWSSSPWGVGGSVTGSASIPTIPRASSISSVANITLGNNCSVTWTPASTSFQYDIRFTLGNWSSSTGKMRPNTTNAYTYNYYVIPVEAALLSQISNSTTGTMTATLYTYNSSGTQIGSASSKTFTVTIPSNIVPIVGTITLSPQTYNYLIQNKNKLNISVSGCSAGTGSSIKSYTFSGPGISSTVTSTSATSGLINNTGTLTYTVTVTDNRGRTASKTATIPCYAYNTPSISMSAYRVSSSTSTTEYDGGTYVRCSYSLSYSSVNNSNDITVKIYYKKNSATSWSSTTAITDSESTSGAITLSSIDAAATYTIYATITDNYGGSSSSTHKTVFGASRILNITSDGTGVAFGKMAESTKLLDVKWPIKSGDPAATMQNLSYRGSDLIDSTANDTVGNWNNQGNLATVFYTKTGQLIDQPSQHGFVLNLTTGPGGKETHQIWATQSGGNLLHRGGNSNGWNGSWKAVLDSANYTNYVSSKPTQLFSSSSGTIGTITLLESAANFTYLEIFYTDNNGRQANSIRVYSPNGKYVVLNCIEPSTNNSEPRIYIRSSGWTISGTSMTVGRSDLNGASRGVYGQLYPHANDTNIDIKITENNYIKIFRILGYK